MSTASDAVAHFHRAFGIPSEQRYVDRVRGRETLHKEEHRELERALFSISKCGCADCQRDVRGKLEHVARELADVLVIAYGTADVLGIDLDLAFERVMQANMAKMPSCSECSGTGELERGGALEGSCYACKGTGKGKPIKRADGKVLKPDGWTPPDMSGAVGA